MMLEHTVIVVGLERSEADHGVLAAARHIAAHSRARLVLVHVVGTPKVVGEALTAPIASLEPSLLDQAETYLVEVAKTVPSTLLAGTAAVDGAPVDALCAVASRRQASLIVIGARGHRRQHVLGSTAGGVVNQSPCSVFVARDTPGRPSERVLVGLDGSDISARVLESAAAFAQGLRRQMILVRAIDGEHAEKSPSGKTRAELELRAYASQVESRAPVSIEVRLGAASSVICDAGREFEADLIVIGAHRHGVVRRLLGTTAARVVENAGRSVLIVK